MSKTRILILGADALIGGSRALPERWTESVRARAHEEGTRTFVVSIPPFPRSPTAVEELWSGLDRLEREDAHLDRRALFAEQDRRANAWLDREASAFVRAIDGNFDVQQFEVGPSHSRDITEMLVVEALRAYQDRVAALLGIFFCMGTPVRLAAGTGPLVWKPYMAEPSRPERPRELVCASVAGILYVPGQADMPPFVRYAPGDLSILAFVAKQFPEAVISYVGNDGHLPEPVRAALPEGQLVDLVFPPRSGS